MEYIFKAIKGSQWGRDTYTAIIPFTQLVEICRVDGEAQRKADNNRISDISDYILDGFSSKRVMNGFNSIVTSLRYANIKYDESSAEVRISARGKLYITDGQHRVGGINHFVEKVEKGLEEAREDNDTEAMAYWQNLLEQLDEMTIPVVIFIELTKDEEQQLFHDLNNLGVAVHQTQALNLDKNDLYNRIAKELELEIPCISKYGISKTAKTLSDKNKAVATLGTWNNCIRILLNGPSDKDIKKPWDEKWDYDNMKSICLVFWNHVFNVMPEDFIDKEKYMITKAAYIQGIAALGHKIIVAEKIENWKLLVDKLKSFDWGYTNSSYSKYGGGSISIKKDKKGEITEKFYFKGTRAAITSVSAVLEEYSMNNNL